eukprot:TRINITY_DN83109_c0_g1_i1.p1 TRINITY_DN83109_c0_g1~~TRINITY_DN83109_c0_g1_i1.p1  ORF type:complete len:605 (+),score=113.49 TRINITY_DN83109_c0_g1_i1:91-1815(+)
MTLEEGGPAAGRGKTPLAIPSKTCLEQTQELTPSLLIEAAEIEHRLRTHVLELIAPSLQKVSFVDSKLKEVKMKIDRLDKEIKKLTTDQSLTGNVQEQLDSFRVEMGEWTRERYDFQEKINSRLSSQDTDLSFVRQQIENQVRNVEDYNKGLYNAGESINALQDQFNELNRFVTDRCQMNRDKIMKLRDEFEMRCHGAETREHRIRDDVTTVASTTVSLKGQVERLKAELKETMDNVSDLYRSKATVVALQSSQDGFTNLAREVDSQVVELRSQLHNIISDVKGHFQTSCEVINSSNSKMIAEMRQNYLEEVHRVDKLIKDAGDTAASRQEFEEEMKNAIRADHVRVLEEVRSSVLEAISKESASTAENTALLMEALTLKKAIKDVEKTVQEEQRIRRVMQDAVSSIVETSLLSVQMDLQDDEDKKSIALFGYKNVDQKDQQQSAASVPRSIHHTNASQTASGGFFLPDVESKASPRRSSVSTSPRQSIRPNTTAFQSRPRVQNSVDAQPPVMLDKRCLSCSGSPSTTLAGFKLACLQYTPNPITYRKVSYTRGEVIQLRDELLMEVQLQLRSV